MLGVGEKLREATRLKEEGNGLVQQKEYRKACKVYRRVFAYTNGLISKEDQAMAQYTAEKDLVSAVDMKNINELKAATYTNLALCYIRLAEFDRAAECASKALEVDPDNVKALVRFGTAATELRQWEKSKDAFVRALKLDPNNAAVKAEVMAWKTKYGKWQEEQSQREKQLFGGKFLS